MYKDREAYLAYQKSYQLKNKEKLREARKGYTNTWKQNHKAEVKLYNKEYNKNWYPENKEKRSEYYKLWRANNKEKINTSSRGYQRQRAKADIQYHLSKILRTRLHHALKGNAKSGSAIKDLGCTVQELKTYLESQFVQGMTWDNWSYTGWHVDHIRPLVSFDLTDREQLLQAVHYKNLQPLWAVDNHSKGAKIMP